MKLIINDNNEITKLELGQHFGLTSEGQSFNIRAKLDWTGTTVHDLLAYAWRGYAVGIQAKLRQKSIKELKELEDFNASINVVELLTTKRSTSLRNQVKELASEKFNTIMDVIKNTHPELMEPGKEEEQSKLIRNAIDNGVSVIFKYNSTE